MTVFHEISPETIDRYEELKAQRKRLKQRKLFFSYEDEYQNLKKEMYFDINTLPNGFRGLDDFKNHPAYKYALSVSNDEIPTNKYIHIVAKQFLDDLEKSENDENFEYVFDYRIAGKISKMTNLMIAPSGLTAGAKIGDMLAGFQWFFIMVSMGWKHRDDIEKRRYEKNVLLIARKSGKTFLTAVMLILLLLIEPKYSNFFSVAPDLELSSLILQEMKNIIESSPALSPYMGGAKDKIEFKLKSSKFTPLATSNNRMDGRLPTAFVADEIGAMRNRYPLDAMESGQMNVKNRTGYLISTAYESLDNPMTQEVETAQKALDGEIDDPTLFALLYKPDEPELWASSDDELLKANPLALELEDTYNFLKLQRQRAIDNPMRRKNFLTKHMNIFVNGEEAETFLSKEDVARVIVDEGTIDWYGKDVYLGLDLSETNDNTAVAMVSYDEDTTDIIAKAWTFYPDEREAEKSKIEKIDYSDAVERGWAIRSSGRVVDYDQIKQFIEQIEDEYGVNIISIGYDKWNGRATASQLSNQGYDMVEIAQNMQGLYPGTKLLRESVLREHFTFETNYILQMNLLNAKMVTNTNMSYMLNKKQSDGKIDMAAALVDALAIVQFNIDEDAESSSSHDMLTFI